MSGNQYFSEEESCSSVVDSLALGISRLAPQEAFPDPSPIGSNIHYARSAEDLMSRVENPFFGENFLPIATRHRNLSFSDAALTANSYSDSESQHEYICGMGMIGNEVSTHGQGIHIGNEMLSSGMKGMAWYETRHLEELQFQKLAGNLARRDEDYYLGSDISSNNERDDLCIDNEFSSVNLDQDKHLKRVLLEKRMLDIANQLLEVHDENNKTTDAPGDVPLDDILVEYKQLYAEISPENYDFALNIMAYIELLNDSSWKATFSYFDKNVKKMIKNIWDKKKASFNDTIDLERFNRDMVLKLMVDFTKWSIDRDFDFGQFLNYCVLVCQLGVVSRKCIFKEAPLYAIGQLRERIKLLKLKDFAHFMFKIVVKEYAQRQVDHLTM